MEFTEWTDWLLLLLEVGADRRGKGERLEKSRRRERRRAQSSLIFLLFRKGKRFKQETLKHSHGGRDWTDGDCYNVRLYAQTCDRQVFLRTHDSFPFYSRADDNSVGLQLWQQGKKRTLEKSPRRNVSEEARRDMEKRLSLYAFATLWSSTWVVVESSDDDDEGRKADSRREREETKFEEGCKRYFRKTGVRREGKEQQQQVQQAQSTQLSTTAHLL